MEDNGYGIDESDDAGGDAISYDTSFATLEELAPSK